MAFGSALTDGSVVANGTYGYVVRFDLTSEEANSVIQVQLQKQGTLMSAVVPAGVSSAILSGYMENINCPDIAFSFSGEFLDVFLKESVYTYVGTNRIGIWFYADPKNVVLATDRFDVPQEARELTKMMSLREAYHASGRDVKFDIDATIDEQKQVLGLK